MSINSGQLKKIYYVKYLSVYNDILFKIKLIDFVKLTMIESLKSIFKKGFNNLPFYLKDFSQNYFNYYRARIFFNMIIIIKIILN